MKGIDVYTLEQELGEAYERIAILEERCDKVRAHANNFGRQHGHSEKPSLAEDGRVFAVSAEVEEIRRTYAIARETGIPFDKVREVIRIHESVVDPVRTPSEAGRYVRFEILSDAHVIDHKLNARCQEILPKVGDEVEFVRPHPRAGTRGVIHWIGTSKWRSKFVNEIGVPVYSVVRRFPSGALAGQSYVTREYFKLV